LCTAGLLLCERYIIIDKLKECATVFEKLLNVRYRCIIARKGKARELVLAFTPYEFHHLCGLNKLADVTVLRRNRERVFKEILSGKISYEMISSSHYFSLISSRLEFLSKLEEFMDSNTIVFSFDKRNRKSSSIEAKYLLQNNIDGEVAYFFIGDSKHTDLLIGISFFIKENTDYSIAQPKWTLLYKEKELCESGEVIVQHDRLDDQDKANLLYRLSVILSNPK